MCQRTFHPVHRGGDVQRLGSSQIEPFVASRQYSAILVVGGSPCQDVSLLKHSRPGAASDRAPLFTAIPNVAQACRAILRKHGIRIPGASGTRKCASRQTGFLPASVCSHEWAHCCHFSRLLWLDKAMADTQPMTSQASSAAANSQGLRRLLRHVGAQKAMACLRSN